MKPSPTIKQLPLLLALLQPAGLALSTTLDEPLEKTSDLCHQLHEQREHSEAIAKCMYGASQHDPRSERILGEIYLYGLGVKTDAKEAEAWLLKAVKDGDEEAYFSLGVINDLGLGIEENNLKAEEYFHKAMESGDTRAIRALGMLYLGEENFPADHKKARHYLKKAWDHGILKAAYYLAESYLRDSDTPDYEEANRWIKLAAINNDARAFLRIAHQYETGLGVERDLREAAHWLRIYLDSDAADPKLLPGTRAHLTTIENRIAQNSHDQNAPEETPSTAAPVKTAPVEIHSNGNGTTPENINQIAARSSLMLYMTDFSGNPISQASAVVVTPEIAATNCHVVRAGTLIHANTHDNQVITAHPIWYNESEDLCLLQLSTPQPHPAQPGSGRDQLRVGQPVFALGSPEGLESTFSSGNISAIRETGNSYQIQTTTPLSHGSSGGGLYNTRAELIGITTSVLKDAQNINFAIPVEVVIDALASSSNGTQIHTKLSNRTIPIQVPEGFKPFGLLNYGTARLIDITLPPDYITLEILLPEEEHGVMASGKPGEEDYPVILIAAPGDELLESEDFQQTSDRVRRQFNALSSNPADHPLMNNMEMLAGKYEAVINRRVSVELTHNPDSIFVDTPEQIGISDTSFTTIQLEGEEPVDELDGTRDTYLLTKDDDTWIGVFLYDPGSTYSFEEAQEVVRGVFGP